MMILLHSFPGIPGIRDKQQEMIVRAINLGRVMRADDLYGIMAKTAEAISESGQTTWQPVLYGYEPNSTGWSDGKRLELGLQSCQQGGNLRIRPGERRTAFRRDEAYRRVWVIVGVGEMMTPCPCHMPTQLDAVEVTETFVRFFQQELSRY